MAPRPVKPRDLRKFVFISDPQTSPDGSKVAYVHTSIDYEKNDYVKHIWIHDIDTGRDNQFTFGEGKDSNPRWSPTGNKLLFLSSGREPDKKNELFVIYASGGEAQKVAELETGIASPLWSPDEKTILFSSRTWETKKPETDVLVVDRIWFKLNGVGMFPGKRVHLFTVKATGGKHKQITKGAFDVVSYTWSPNGKEIAYVTNKEKDQDTSYVKDIYVMPTKGGEAQKITEGIHEIGSFSWSKHGIAYFGSDFHARGATNTDLWVMKPGEKPKNLTQKWDRSLTRGIGSDLRIGTPDPGPVWSGDEAEIYFLTGEVPLSSVYKVNLKTKKIEPVTSGISVDGFNFSNDFRVLAYNAMTATEPCELYINGKKATRFNEKHIKSLWISKPEHHTWINELGETIDGWIMKPYDFKPDTEYPTVLQIHGGPLAIYGEGIYQEFQLLTSAGYAVIYTNPRGSGGYGEEYASCLNGGYGTVDYKDVMDFTADAVKRFSFIDETRLGVTGGSYGGYLTNWIISQTPLFKAAVTCRSTCNRYSHHGYSDFGFKHGESGNMGYPWRDGDKLLSQSPLRFAANVKTPTLFIHSENDLRCPIQQAEEYFVALMEQGIDTELVRFPDENHELSRSGKPKHREERFEHILRWFNKCLKP
ncbi:S9 family peptidase [Candidatus Bathyarchaeota archaeon]|nr:S9 family peptidase [Candidatus Bathyarchaeota archaeon]